MKNELSQLKIRQNSQIQGVENLVRLEAKPANMEGKTGAYLRRPGI